MSDLTDKLRATAAMKRIPQKLAMWSIDASRHAADADLMEAAADLIEQLEGAAARTAVTRKAADDVLSSLKDDKC